MIRLLVFDFRMFGEIIRWLKIADVWEMKKQLADVNKIKYLTISVDVNDVVKKLIFDLYMLFIVFFLINVL